MKKKLTRREARTAAFSLIYEASLRDDGLPELLEAAQEAWELSLDGYAEQLVGLTLDNLAEIDEKIERHLSKWKLSRLPKVTLAILRLSVCEIDRFDDIPASVTINEAVELAKTYATEEDAAYLNGVLGAYVKAALPQTDTEGAAEAKE